jgi:hypothetical protein
MRYFRTWGASAVDLTRAMTGDARIATPSYVTTLAVTIDAPPRDVWPWLAQIGYRRGGLYSYDWLDRLFGYLDGPSAERILPEFQYLRAGDVIPIGRGPGFPVAAVEAGRTLVLGGETDGMLWTWELALFPDDGRRTRLVSRNRVRLPQTLGSRLLMAIIEPAAFIMTRKMLLGIKRRAESPRAVRAAA